MWMLLLGTMGVKSLVQGLNAAATAGFEPRTVWSEVRRCNRLATAPLPLRLFYSILLHQCYSNFCRSCLQVTVCITSWYPNSNGSHFGLPPNSVHRMVSLEPGPTWLLIRTGSPFPWRPSTIRSQVGPGSRLTEWSDSVACERLRTHRLDQLRSKMCAG